ncbi:MAG TPA: glycosyltransferase family 39 protein, partial [Tepidisphaeraceae bacterium]|nr:glycosyltransferase family 39 protein [Tepidisphaeraceae bacterium]
MSCVSPSPLSDVSLQRVWKLGWLTPIRCRVILAGLLALGLIGHLRYLNNNCPLDLSGDEAHYWDWSRQLGWSYYSKGPLVAYLIRASCALFGETMPAVRYPALALAIGTSLATYWLARKLFESDRVALGAVLLYHVVPMFIAGSVLMTIDPPFFFCWGLATCFAAKAVFEGRRWAWLAMGMTVGVGFLAKYAMFLWLVSLLVFLIVDRDARRYLRSPWPWVAVAVALLFTTPVIVWNAQNGWASLWHVTRQTGTGSEASFDLSNPLEFVGGQIGAMGPMLSVILVGAVVYALGRWGSADPHRRGMRFLTCIGLTYFAIVAVTSLRTKIQVNWPAPAYFTLVILAAYFLGTRLQSPGLWKP